MFQIIDWAGNICFAAKTFTSFEDAWAFLYEMFDHLSEKDFDDEMSEYRVEKVKGARQ